MPTVLVRQDRSHRKSDTLGILLRRVFDASAALGPPVLHLRASDSPVGGVSAVARAVKKHPELAPLARPMPMMGVGPPVNTLATEGTDARLGTELLLALADGVPRSLPFHALSVTAIWPPPVDVRLDLRDDWWVSGRRRSSSIQWTAEVAEGAKALPEPPAGLTALLDALGKPKSVTRLPAIVADPGVRAAVAEVTARARSGLPARMAELRLPHALPGDGLGAPAGPLKPALVETFGPRGYDCRGGHGTFTLRRRASTNHVVELSLDVGTWSHRFTGHLLVWGPEFRAALPLLPGAVHGVPIPSADGWRRIVENLAVVVDDLEGTFVAEVTAAAGPCPAWFEPPAGVA